MHNLAINQQLHGFAQYLIKHHECQAYQTAQRFNAEGLRITLKGI